jgi:hypothetical protein
MSALTLKLVLTANMLYFAMMAALTGNLLHNNTVPEQRPLSWAEDWGAFCVLALLATMNFLGVLGLGTTRQRS